MARKDKDRPYDVFISYSGDAAKEALELCEMFDRQGIHAFSFEQSLGEGRVWEDPVLRALRMSHCILVLVSDKSSQSPWVNQEIGLARAFGKYIVPIALDGAFDHRHNPRGMLERYWGISFSELKNVFAGFIQNLEITGAFRIRRYWANFLTSDNVLVVHGGFEPGKLGRRARFVDHGDLRAIAFLIAVMQREFGIDLQPQLRFSADLSKRDLTQAEIIVVGGKIAHQDTFLEDLFTDAEVQFEVDQYLVGDPPKVIKRCHERENRVREPCLVLNLRNPMNIHRRAIIFAGVSGFGAQGAVEHLLSSQINAEAVEEIKGWNDSDRKTPLIAQVNSTFDSNVFVSGSSIWQSLTSSG